MDDLYTDSAFDAEAVPNSYIEILDRINRIDDMLYNIKKKGKNKKKGGGKNKKLKRRLKALEMENEQIKYFLKVYMAQNKTTQNSSWWHSVMSKSAPKLIDLVSAVIQSKHQPLIHTLPTKNQLYLTSGSDRK